MITTEAGLPVHYIHAGSFADVRAFQTMPVNLPEQSQLYADSGYTCYELEELFAECEQVQLPICRKANAKRKEEPHVAFLKNYYPKCIETTFSGITNFFPKKIHAVTAQGFILKIILFIFAFTLNQLIIQSYIIAKYWFRFHQW